MFALDTAVRAFQGESLPSTSGYLDTVGNILGEGIERIAEIEKDRERRERGRVRERQREREKEGEREKKSKREKERG